MPSYRSSRVVTEGELRPATISVSDGLVTMVGEGMADVDLGDLVVMPGLVDSHVHVNEPGRTEWEGFETATLSAIAGGTTTIVDMPLNSIPPTVDSEALEVKRAAATGKLYCDVAFWGGIIPGSDPWPLVDEGVCGFKVFLTESGVPEFPPMSLEMLGETPPLPLLFHAETDSDLEPLRSPAVYADYLASRPPRAEASAIVALGGLAGRVHVLHVSSGDAVEAVGAGPETMSAETCPHYLTFSAEDIGPTDTQFKCAPPIRDAAHREALWDGLANGLVEMVVSDHSPSPPELKTKDFATSWGGISGVQLRLPVVWTGAIARGHTPVDVVRWLATAPATLAGLDDRKGSIAVGMDADLVVFDPEARWQVRGATLLHRHKQSPYEGMTLTGRVIMTLLGGVPVYEDGRVGARRGRMLSRR